MGHDLIARNQKSKVRGPVFFVGIAKLTNWHEHAVCHMNIYRMGRVYGTILHAEEVFFIPLEVKPEIEPCHCDDCVRRTAHV
jgi:hypothetical protein